MKAEAMGDELKAKVLADMTIDFHKCGLGATHYGEQCDTCPSRSAHLA